MFKFSGSKCTCPHCRGGHNLNVEPPLEEYADAEDGDTEVVFTADDEDVVEGIALVSFTEEEATEHCLSVVTELMENLANAETESEAQEIIIGKYSTIFNYGYSVCLRNNAMDNLEILQRMQDEGKI